MSTVRRRNWVLVALTLSISMLALQRASELRATPEASEPSNDVVRPAPTIGRDASVEPIQDLRPQAAAATRPEILVPHPRDEASARAKTRATERSDEPAAVDRFVREQLDLLERTLGTEGRDGRWADQSEQEFLALFSGAADDEVLPLELLDARCGTSMCALRFEVPGAVDPVAAVNAAASKVPWGSEKFVRVSTEGANAASVYVARDGARLPHADMLIPVPDDQG